MESNIGSKDRKTQNNSNLILRLEHAWQNVLSWQSHVVAWQTNGLFDKQMPDLGGSWPFSEWTEWSSLFLLLSEIKPPPEQHNSPNDNLMQNGSSWNWTVIESICAAHEMFDEWNDVWSMTEASNKQMDWWNGIQLVLSMDGLFICGSDGGSIAGCPVCFGARLCGIWAEKWFASLTLVLETPFNFVWDMGWGLLGSAGNELQNWSFNSNC